MDRTGRVEREGGGGRPDPPAAGRPWGRVGWGLRRKSLGSPRLRRGSMDRTGRVEREGGGGPPGTAGCRATLGRVGWGLRRKPLGSPRLRRGSMDRTGRVEREGGGGKAQTRANRYRPAVLAGLWALWSRTGVRPAVLAGLLAPSGPARVASAISRGEWPWPFAFGAGFWESRSRPSSGVRCAWLAPSQPGANRGPLLAVLA